MPPRHSSAQIQCLTQPVYIHLYRSISNSSDQTARTTHAYSLRAPHENYASRVGASEPLRSWGLSRAISALKSVESMEPGADKRRFHNFNHKGQMKDAFIRLNYMS